LKSGWNSRFANLSTGIRLHYVEAGVDEKGTVVFCHGWPEFWFSWRHQIDPVAKLGFRVIVPDQRGFGKTAGPHNKSQYTLEHLTADMVALLDVLKVSKAVFVGHDWGSPVVWCLALHYPERVAAVASYVVPFHPTNPKKNPWKAMNDDPRLFDYQMYFQEEGRAEKEFEKNIPYTFKCIIRSSKQPDRIAFTQHVSMGNARARGGMLIGFPGEEELKRTIIMNEEELQGYVNAYKESGFRGGLNWYRNMEDNWKFNCKVAGKKILQPALMITVEKDKLFPPAASKHMEQWIPNLTRGHIEGVGHWIEEEPEKLNSILGKWLQSLPRGGVIVSKL